jgi:competence protein ComEC
MVVAALGFVLGAWLLQQQANLPSLQAAWAYILIFGAPSLIVLFKFQNFKLNLYLRSACLLVLATLFGFYWTAIFAAIRLSDELPKAWEQKSIDIIGVVATLPEVTERGERFQFDVEKILTPQAIVPKHISLNFYREVEPAKPENVSGQANSFYAARFKAGQRWQFTVRLKRPHSTYNPHGFDMEAWALEQNIRATGTIKGKSGYKKLANFVWRPSYIVEHLREKIGNRISQTLANKPYAGVLRALVMGDDSQIAVQDWNVYLRTGTSHLMSISGLHITMLAGLAFACIAFMWRRIPSLVLRMPTRQAATVGGMLVAIIYACLAGLSVPTQRTLFMLMTFAFALLIGKKVPISRVLAIALLVVVLIDPWAVSAPGFWLSFGAIAIIAYVSVSRMKSSHWLHEAVNTQWAVTIGMLPALILMFGQASIISPIANSFAIPVISLAVVPLAILGALLPVDFVLQVSHWTMVLCMQGLAWLANLPIATWQQAAAPVWAIILAVVGMLWLLLPRGIPQRWLGLILLAPMLIVHPPRPKQSEMKVAVLDVGQGLSVVIQTANHTLLYDAGPSYSSQSDAGSKIIVPFLRGEGITKLDGFIVSHNDSDHSGGAASVLAQVPVNWLASSFDMLQSLPKMPRQLHCAAGQKWVWDDVKFEVLYPSLPSYANPDLSDNNRGCVVKATSQFGSILLSADIEKEAEAELLQTSSNILRSDILIAPHHGSMTSSTPEFVQAVGAKNIIFTVGYLNRFKHPKPLIEKRYEESGAHLYRSDYAGEIEINFSKSQPLQISAWRQLQPKYWQDSY